MNKLDAVEMILTAQSHDLGDFTVGRVLPRAARRAIGPFVFFDHLGPGRAAARLRVRPHPHINLATVTYLFGGAIRHRDSLGTDQLIEPGAINWMVAGRGIVHSESSPDAAAAESPHGIQVWVALPDAVEECAPSLAHHPSSSLPEFEVGAARIKLLLGAWLGRRSPVHIHSDLFYADVSLTANDEFTIPGDGRELAVYVIEGAVTTGGRSLSAGQMVVARTGANLDLKAHANTRMMMLGGVPLGPRFLNWNFVSSSKDRIVEARQSWADGPRVGHPRFCPIPGDDAEFIPLPNKHAPGSAL